MNLAEMKFTHPSHLIASTPTVQKYVIHCSIHVHTYIVPIHSHSTNYFATAILLWLNLCLAAT